MKVAKITSAAIDLHNPDPGTKAIDIRRRMINIPEVTRSLSMIEQHIFSASTKQQISEIDDAVLVEKTAQLFRFIAIDVGYQMPQNSIDWQYTCTRLLDILKRYYSHLTLSDIKMAFELSVTGELDDYLPKDSKGNPDRKHYQQFNADYFSRILNAYSQKQNAVINKAYQSLPAPQMQLSPELIRQYRNDIRERCKTIFLEYKYSGRLNFGMFDEMHVYGWLIRCGLSDSELKETDADRKQAFNVFLAKAAQGFVNDYILYHVRKQGASSPEINFTVYEVARRKEIIRTFDYMISNEIQIANYLTLEI